MNKECPTCQNMGYIDIGDCEDGVIRGCPNEDHDYYMDAEEDE